MKRPNIQKGIGIIEVLLTTLVVSLGFLAIASLHGNLMSSAGSNKTRAEAMELATQKMEELRDRILLSGYTALASGYDAALIAGTNENFFRYWIVTDLPYPASTTSPVNCSATPKPDDCVGPQRKRIQVNVAWPYSAVPALTNNAPTVAPDDEKLVKIQSVIAFDNTSFSNKLNSGDTESSLSLTSPTTNAGSSTWLGNALPAGGTQPDADDTGQHVTSGDLTTAGGKSIPDGTVYNFCDSYDVTYESTSEFGPLIPYEYDLYTRRIHYQPDTSTFKEAIELFQNVGRIASLGGGAHDVCLLKIRYNGGVIIPMKGRLYSATAGSNAVSFPTELSLLGSESGIFCEFTDTSPGDYSISSANHSAFFADPVNKSVPYACYVGGNCTNGPLGTIKEDTSFTTDSAGRMGVAKAIAANVNNGGTVPNATTGENTIVTQCPAKDPNAATGKNYGTGTDIFATVGPGGWRGNLGLSGLISGNNKGFTTCLPPLQVPPTVTTPTPGDATASKAASARGYYTLWQNGTVLNNQGINKPYICHDFLLVDPPTNMATGLNCVSASTVGALKLATHPSIRWSSDTGFINAFDSTVGKSSCHIITGSVLSGTTSVTGTSTNGGFDCTVNTTDNTYQCVGTTKASTAIITAINSTTNTSVDCFVTGLNNTALAVTGCTPGVAPTATYTVSGNITEGTNVKFSTKSDEYDPLTMLTFTGATCTKAKSGGTYSYSCTQVPENTTIAYSAGLGYVSNPATVTVASANVTQNIVINTTTTYTLLIGSSGTGGTTDPAPATYTYNSGTSVTITAIPDSGYTFTGWSGGACSGTNLTCTITMDNNKTVTPSFAPSTMYTLLIGTSGSGGTTDPTAGTYSHVANSSVTITAKPNTGYIFTGWTGDCSGTSLTCTVTMTSDKQVTATFEATTTYDLLIGTTGSGGTTSPSAGTYTYNSGTSVTITAEAKTGFIFKGWTGDCSGTSPTCTVTMTSNKEVTATFEATTTYDLLIGTSGSGGITKPSAGTYTYNSGTSVTITAEANTGFIFKEWTGDCSGTSPTCTVTMTANKQVTATFTALTPYNLVIATSGTGGTTNPTPGTYTKYSGDSVDITATAITGYVFTGWSGACSGTAPTCTVTITNSDKQVTASFAQETITCSVAISGTTKNANAQVTSSPLSCNVSAGSDKTYTCPTVAGVANGTVVTVTSGGVSKTVTVACPTTEYTVNF